MVDWGALEKRCGREVTVGSNPTLSAPLNIVKNPFSLIIKLIFANQPLVFHCLQFFKAI